MIRLGGKQNIRAGPSSADNGNDDDQSSGSDEETPGTEGQGGGASNGLSKFKPVVISKRTRYKPKPGDSGRGEVEVYSYSQIQNRMKDKHYRTQTQDDLKHVKINQRKTHESSDVLELEVAKEEDLDAVVVVGAGGKEGKMEDESARFVPYDEGEAKTRDGGASSKPAAPTRVLTRRRRKAEPVKEVGLQEMLANSSGEEEEGALYGVQCSNWEDQVLWGDEQEEEAKNSLSGGGGAVSQYSYVGRATFGTSPNAVECVGVNRALNGPGWLKGIVWDDSWDDRTKPTFEVRIDPTDRSLLMQPTKALRSYAERVAGGRSRAALGAGAGGGSTLEEEESESGLERLVNKNRIHYQLIEVYRQSNLAPHELRGNFTFNKAKLPIRHAEAAMRFLDLGEDPNTFQYRQKLPLYRLQSRVTNESKDLHEHTMRVIPGRPFNLPMEEVALAERESLHAHSKQQGEIVLFEYLEESPILLNEKGMGATVVHYDMRARKPKGKGSEPISSAPDHQRKQDGEAWGQQYGHAAKLDEKSHNTFPLLGSENVRKGVVDSVLWTNLARARVKLQPPSKTDFLVSVRAKRADGKKKKKLGGKATVWPLPPVFAVGQQEYVRTPGRGGNQLRSFQKNFLKHQLFKKIQKQVANQDKYSPKARFQVSEEKLKADFPLSLALFTSAYKSAKSFVFELKKGEHTRTLRENFQKNLDEHIKDIEKEINLEDFCLHKSMLEALHRFQALTLMSPSFFREVLNKNPQSANIILDPLKGPLRLLMNIQKRRENRVNYLRREYQKTQRQTGFFDLSVYEKRITAVDAAVQRGRQEIDCVKMFVAALQTYPEKVVNSFYNCHVWAKRASKKNSKSLRIRLNGPGNPFGVHNAGFSYVVDEGDGGGDKVGASKTLHSGQRGGYESVRVLNKRKYHQLRNILMNELGQDEKKLESIKSKEGLIKMIQKLRSDVAAENENQPGRLERKDHIDQIVENQRRLLAGKLTLSEEEIGAATGGDGETSKPQSGGASKSPPQGMDWTGLKPSGNDLDGTKEEEGVLYILNEFWTRNPSRKPKFAQRESKNRQATNQSRQQSMLRKMNVETKKMKNQWVRTMKTTYDEAGRIKRCTVTFRKQNATDNEDKEAGRQREKRRDGLLKYEPGMELVFKKKRARGSRATTLLLNSKTTSKSRAGGSSERGGRRLSIKLDKSVRRSQSNSRTFAPPPKKKKKSVSNSNEYERQYQKVPKRRKIDPIAALNKDLENVVTKLAGLKYETFRVDALFWLPVIKNWPQIEIDYLAKLKASNLKPMDLSTMQKKCYKKKYNHRDEFMTDVGAISSACEAYNRNTPGDAQKFITMSKWMVEKAEEFLKNFNM